MAQTSMNCCKGICYCRTSDSATPKVIQHPYPGISKYKSFEFAQVGRSSSPKLHISLSATRNVNSFEVYSPSLEYAETWLCSSKSLTPQLQAAITAVPGVFRFRNLEHPPLEAQAAKKGLTSLSPTAPRTLPVRMRATAQAVVLQMSTQRWVHWGNEHLKASGGGGSKP